MDLNNMDINNLTSSQRAELEQKVKAGIAQAQAAELIQRVNERCLTKCIDYPGTSLTNSQQTCLTRCMERYFESWNVVAQAYQTRLSKEGGGMQ